MARKIIPPIDRLMRWVVVDGTCWRATRGLRRDGYCQIQLTGKRAPKVLGHRLVFEHFVGPIPGGLELDHVWARGCRFRSCVNPAHLEPVTRPVNIRRGTQAARAAEYYERYWTNRTHCDNGHELAVVGIHVESPSGHRQCRACHLQQKRENHQRVMADPAKAARRREQMRRAAAKYRAKKGAAA